MAEIAEFDFGLFASKITACASGIRASGKPSCIAASVQLLTIEIACG